MIRILRYALALAHTVIEYVSIDGDRVVVGVRPWRSRGLRCPVCGRRCECYDRSSGPRSWRAMDLARSMCFPEYRTRRVSCPEHGVLVESVPWARHKARFTRDFNALPPQAQARMLELLAGADPGNMAEEEKEVAAEIIEENAGETEGTAEVMPAIVPASASLAR